MIVHALVLQWIPAEHLSVKDREEWLGNQKQFKQFTKHIDRCKREFADRQVILIVVADLFPTEVQQVIKETLLGACTAVWLGVRNGEGFDFV